MAKLQGWPSRTIGPTISARAPAGYGHTGRPASAAGHSQPAAPCRVTGPP
jgi:hypothetical protein